MDEPQKQSLWVLRDNQTGLYIDCLKEHTLIPNKWLLTDNFDEARIYTTHGLAQATDDILPRNRRRMYLATTSMPDAEFALDPDRRLIVAERSIEAILIDPGYELPGKGR